MEAPFTIMDPPDDRIAGMVVEVVSTTNAPGPVKVILPPPPPITADEEATGVTSVLCKELLPVATRTKSFTL